MHPLYYVLAALGYCLVMGVVGRLIVDWTDDDEVGLCLVAVWPVALPIIVGAQLAEWIRNRLDNADECELPEAKVIK